MVWYTCTIILWRDGDFFFFYENILFPAFPSGSEGWLIAVHVADFDPAGHLNG